VDIAYFPRPEQLVKWAGLAPRVLQSGHKKRVTGKLHKGGNKYLRRALTLACKNIHAKGNSSNPVYTYIKPNTTANKIPIGAPSAPPPANYCG